MPKQRAIAWAVGLPLLLAASFAQTPIEIGTPPEEFTLDPTVLFRNAGIIVQEKRSGEKWSSKGKICWPGYELKSDPPPEGYLLISASFELRGDRACGYYARCKEKDHNAKDVTFSFCMQGHDENGSSGKSEGFLTTFYRKPSSQHYTLHQRTTARYSATQKYFGCFENGKIVKHVEGPWCEMVAAPPNPGYTIKWVSFNLDGDRSCHGDDLNPQPKGEWAQCRQKSRTDTTAIWQFKMQGYEKSSEGVFASFGTLDVTYELIGKSSEDETWELIERLSGR